MNGRNQMVGAVYLILIKDGKILLLRRQNTGYEDGKYSLVAGHMEENEEVVPAIIREAKEEAGITIVPENIKVVGVMHRKESPERIDFFLCASAWEGEIKNMEPDKCSDLSWFDLNDLPDNLIPYVRKAISNYLNGVWFDSFGW